MVSRELGQQIAALGQAAGLGSPQDRELAIYRLNLASLRCTMPALYGLYADPDRRATVIAMEDLTGRVRQHGPERDAAWPQDDLDAVLRGLARFQAPAFGVRGRPMRERLAAAGVGHLQAEQALPLWRSLADHAEDALSAWAGSDTVKQLRQLIDRFDAWYGQYVALGQTVIHNDFTPRNIALRGQNDHAELCAYDWELAGLGSPQRDVAEFLCYTLNEHTHPDEIRFWVHRHREHLAAASGIEPDSATWEEGFVLALYCVLTTRLTALALIHRVHAQPYLPKVVRTWRHVHDALR
jgi:aminoglycoside phosphotransferase (APT) family kinase protein